MTARSTIGGSSVRQQVGRGGRRALFIVALYTAAVQALAATWLVRDFESPNAAREIAENIAAGGQYEGGNWARLTGDRVNSAQGPLRMYHLPGEPLYLAAGFVVLPEGALRYLHVPVTVLLVTSAAAVALALYGPACAFVTGLVAASLPFIVLHGPVWDDAFLGAGLVWLVLALLASRLAKDQPRDGSRRHLEGAVVLLAAGAAAVTRSDARLIFALLAVSVVLLVALRPIRRQVLLALAGTVLSVALWGGRNAVVSGRFVTSTTHDGITLWESNGPHTRNALARGTVEELSYDPVVMRRHWVVTGGMTEHEVNRYFRDEAVAYAVDRPLDVARTAFMKLGITALGVRPELALLTPRNVVSILQSVALLVLGTIGLTRIGRSLDRDRAIAFATLGAIVTLVGGTMILVGPAGLRYRVLIEPMLWIGTGASMTRALRVVAGASWGAELNVTGSTDKLFVRVSPHFNKSAKRSAHFSNRSHG